MSTSKAHSLARAFMSPHTKASKLNLIDDGFFSEDFYSYEDTAIAIYKDYLNDFRDLELAHKVPYKLSEDYKLYAVDALIIAHAIGCESEVAEAIARIFNAFYMAVHYYDDHVEHPDKFFSKFELANTADTQTQLGALPFSFMLTTYLIINKYLTDPALAYTDETKIKLATLMFDRLLRYTPYLTSERKQHLTTNEVLVMKQRNISGSATMIIADLIKPIVDKNITDVDELSKGLFLLGSLTQITDDIRDANIDHMLRNANLLNSVIEMIGEGNAYDEVADIYLKEEAEARSHLLKAMGETNARLILSIPFYPFFIDKSKLIRS